MQQIYRYPLSQQVGAACEPAVQPGGRVERGQKIAKIPAGKLGANLHTAVSGTVEAVTGAEISIRADARQPDGFVPIEGEDIVGLVREAGIVGMGGAGFPTHVKLGTKLAPGGAVLANCAECEPILCHNVGRLERRPEQFCRGLALAMEAVGAERAIIAIKEKHVEAVRSVKNAIDPARMELHLLPDLYPMGEERAVVRECLGRLLPAGALPAEANAVVINAETLCRIAEAVDEKKPSISKDVTVAGRLNGNAVQRFYDVPAGTGMAELLRRAGGTAGAYGELIRGGPFTGRRTEEDAPVTKTTGGVIAAMPFLRERRPIGLLVCACGPDRERMEEIAASMGAPVAAVERCKNAEPSRGGSLKCRNPGCCPGQAERVLRLKKAGARALLIGNCTDCTNTVMTVAPRLGLPVHHCTDGALRAVNFPLIRRMKLNGADGRQ